MRLIFIPFLLISNFLQAQIFDSLKDYSYTLFLGKKHEQSSSINGIGTGFFIRHNDKLFLVSAEHVLTGNDPFKVNRIDSLSPDFLVFYYRCSGNAAKGFKNLYLDSIKKTHPPQSIKSHADLITTPIDLPEDAQIKTIEYFINPKIDLKPGDSVFSWGFPQVKTDIDSTIMFYYQNPSPIKYVGTAFILNDSSLYYASIPDSKKGASGSPMFVKRSLKGIDKYYFIGVLCAGSEESGVVFFVKHKELLKSLKP